MPKKGTKRSCWTKKGGLSKKKGTKKRMRIRPQKRTPTKIVYVQGPQQPQAQPQPTVLGAAGQGLGFGFGFGAGEAVAEEVFDFDKE